MNIYIKNNIRSIIFYLLSLFNIIIFFNDIAKGNIIYENSKEEVITKGVKYENKKIITDKGFLNVNIIKVDITKDSIKILPIQSDTFGKKETVRTLLEKKGAVAGINADYFNMKDDITTSMGSIICDSKILSTNEMENGYATFFINKENNPFIEYLKPKIIFKNNGEINMNIKGINKFYKDFNAVYFDRQAINNTSILDNKFKDLVKFVVEDNIITYISQGGEIVDIPENGFVIVAAATYAQHFYNSVKVGDKVEIYVEAEFNFDTINMAISGGGKIVENGFYSNYGYVVSPLKKEPRSAIGINKEGTEIILVTVDGRKESVGATHKEMADILISLGAHNAMHLDGGGSTTMVVKPFNDSKLQLVNNIANLEERKIVNTIGIFNNAPKGIITSLEIKTYPEKVFYGSYLDICITGLDDHLNKIELKENIKYDYNKEEGELENNIFYPKKLGNISIKAKYNNIEETKNIECLKLEQLYSLLERIETYKNSITKLNFEGVSTTGIILPINIINYEIYPSNLGIIEKDSFIAKENGTGYIKAIVGEISTIIPISIGKKEELITNFSGKDNISFEKYPETVKGCVYYEDIEDKKVLNLNYKFNTEENIQSAYINFKDKISFRDNPICMKISVYGDKSNNLLRGKLIDGKEEEFIVDVAEKIDWDGWKDIIVNFPNNISYPIKLESFYLVSLNNNDNNEKNIYLSNLICLYNEEEDIKNIQKDNINRNYFKETLEDIPKNGSFDISFIPDITFKEKPNNYQDIKNIITSKIENSSLKVFLSEKDIDNKNYNYKKWNETYKFELFNNIALVSLNNSSLSFTETSLYNWSFVNESKSSNANNIIILINKNINLMKSKSELELFERAVEEIKNTGKNVFVISFNNINTTDNLKNGINYINLSSLFREDGSINDDFAILKIRITNNNTKFDIRKIFKNSTKFK